MADINRLHRTLWVPFALLALAACTPANDPAQTVERDAGTESAPARPVGEAMQMQPAQPAEGEALPDAVDVQRNADGSVDVRKATPESAALRRTEDGAWRSARWILRPSRGPIRRRPRPGRSSEPCHPGSACAPRVVQRARRAIAMFSFVQAFRFLPSPATMNA